MKVEVIICEVSQAQGIIQVFLNANPGISIISVSQASRNLGDPERLWTVETTIIYKEPLDTSDCD